MTRFSTPLYRWLNDMTFQNGKCSCHILNGCSPTASKLILGMFTHAIIREKQKIASKGVWDRKGFGKMSWLVWD